VVHHHAVDGLLHAAEDGWQRRLLACFHLFDVGEEDIFLTKKVVCQFGTDNGKDLADLEDFRMVGPVEALNLLHQIAN
jgi:hypothetical protein